MPDLIDLHTHSIASDGSDTPAQLVRLACEKKLKGIALTDHDTVSGIPEFLAEAGKAGITGVPGVEISSRLFSKEVHIVGLFIDPGTPALLELLGKMRNGREKRNREIVQKLCVLGYQISYDELREAAGGESIGRPHIGALLIRKGYFATMQDVFVQCLKRGCRAYVPRELPEAAEAVTAIHAAGGLAVWAHPVSGQAGERGYAKKMLRKLLEFGIDAVETNYSMFSEHQTQMMHEIAEAAGVLKSGGSDYHGANQPGIELGSGAGSLAVPAEFLDRMLEKRKCAV